MINCLHNIKCNEVGKIWSCSSWDVWPIINAVILHPYGLIEWIVENEIKKNLLLFSLCRDFFFENQAFPLKHNLRLWSDWICCAHHLHSWSCWFHWVCEVANSRTHCCPGRASNMSEQRNKHTPANAHPAEYHRIFRIWSDIVKRLRKISAKEI